MSRHAFSLRDIGGLDSASFVPLYRQLADKISALIETSGGKATGKVLPSELECARHFRISRPTVRQAMSHLTREGLIVRKKGRGTFVAPPNVSHDMAHGFEDEMRAGHRNVQFRMLEWRRVPAPPGLVDVLDVNGDQQVWYLKRLRIVDGAPFGIEERFFPAGLGSMISASDAKSQPMLRLLRKVMHEDQVELDIEVISAAAATEVAKLLKAKRGVPILMKKLTYIFNGRAQAFAITTFLGERYRFHFTVNIPI
jgi:GntR family transcriptional regulator, N-acetylglucosamine utilization regulator